MPEFMNIDSPGIRIKRTDQPSMWDDFEFGKPGLYSTYFDDFHQYVAADWTITDVGVNTRALATSAPCAGGVLLTTLANADDNSSSRQRLGHAFVPTAGSVIYFEARFQLSEATQADYLVGLVVTDTSPLSNTDGIYFRKDDGDTNLDFETNASSVASTETGIHTVAANTYIKVGCKITGTNLVEYWVNDVKQGEFNTNIPAVPLRVTSHFQDGDTGAVLGSLTLSEDYIFCAQKRV